MPTPQKAKAIETATEKYQKAEGIFFTEYRGLKVSQLQELRKELKGKGGELQVIKNTLFRIAAGDDAEKFSEEMTSGPTAVAFVYENESDCAKVLMDFAKTNKNLVVKGGMVGGKLFDAAAVENLSKLPPREVLIAQVLGAIAAPLSNLVGVVEALYADPIRTIGAVADKAEKEGGVAAAAPADAPADEAPAEETAAPAEEPAAEAAPTEENSEEKPQE